MVLNSSLRCYFIAICGYLHWRTNIRSRRETDYLPLKMSYDSGHLRIKKPEKLCEICSCFQAPGETGAVFGWVLVVDQRFVIWRPVCRCCRDLPQYGHRQWQSYFGKTFDVYTKLWKFQQQHRSDKPGGLRRCIVSSPFSKLSCKGKTGYPVHCQWELSLFP